MSTRGIVLLSEALLVGLLCSSGGAAAGAAEPAPRTLSTNTCLVLSVEGQVQVQRRGVEAWESATIGQELKPGDAIRTGARSRAAIRLSSQAVLRLDQLETTTPEPVGGGGLFQRRGTIYFFHRFLNRTGRDAFRFNTPTASGTIRGTEFVLTVDEDGSTRLAILDGEVEVDQPEGSLRALTGESVRVGHDRTATKSALLNAVHQIQWCLYYPGILIPQEGPWENGEWRRHEDSIAAYLSGDLRLALERCPEPARSANAGQLYHAALLLSVGRVEACEAALQDLERATSGRDDLNQGVPLRRWAGALRRLVAAVRGEEGAADFRPASASEWLAESYYRQSRMGLGKAGQGLGAAREAAAEACRLAPSFGFAWARLAELEFGFGATVAAEAALQKALALSPRHAPAFAVEGFVLSAQNRMAAAEARFAEAIRIDGSLADGWLGRGLCRIRRGLTQAGQEDLQIAAALEPQRSLLRSYLAKALQMTGDRSLAIHELELARRLDPGDPTSWLYLALLRYQENRVNEAIRALEQSKALNNQRQVYRSGLLLDQDRAVRSANLAALYRDSGMVDVSLRKAYRAVIDDYANASAHLFLANSYDAVRDPRGIDLRYESVWFSEWLMANLLAPVGAGPLSQQVSHLEYSRLFDRDGVGFSSLTEYLSHGDWLQRASHFGASGGSAYALDFEYLHEPGYEAANTDRESLSFTGKIKQELSPQDRVMVVAQYLELDSGDLRRYRDPANASPTLRVSETQDPNVFVGYDHAWSPGSHTLVLLGLMRDTLSYREPLSTALVTRRENDGRITQAQSFPLASDEAFADAYLDTRYARRLQLYSGEVQQVWQGKNHTLVGGVRWQGGRPEAEALVLPPASGFPPIFGDPASSRSLRDDLWKFGAYAYDTWQPVDTLRLTAGCSYDRIEYPKDLESTSLVPGQLRRDQWSPKLGALWSPVGWLNVRAAWSRWLGGAYHETGMRLEPTQVAGFNQLYRSLLPESAALPVAGILPASRFELWGLGADYRLGAGTYLGLEWLGREQVGHRAATVFNYTLGQDALPASTEQSLAFDETTIAFTLNHRIGDYWTIGARYAWTDTDLVVRYPEIPPEVQASVNTVLDLATEASLQELAGYARFTHPTGFFAGVEALWLDQENEGESAHWPDDTVCQISLAAGWRFWSRRAEVSLGVLNVTDQDYRLNPLSTYSRLARERTLFCRWRVEF